MDLDQVKLNDKNSDWVSRLLVRLCRDGVNSTRPAEKVNSPLSTGLTTGLLSMLLLD